MVDQEGNNNLERSDNNKNVEEVDYTIDFVTSSAISKISLKFLFIYIPILWAGGYLATATFFSAVGQRDNWITTIILSPFWLIGLYFVFIFGIAIFTKAFLLIVNMVHKPKEGVFRAEKGDQDFEFWRLRIELTKLALWFMTNSPLPWIVMWGFRWFGVHIDFSSHLQDAWVDTDFIEFGRKVTIGQGSTVMSSMVVGKYLIIRKIIFEDYTVVGGVSNISPGTIFGKEAVTGAFTNTYYNQFLEPGWIHIGLPAMKYKPNKYARERRGKIYRKDVEKEVTYEVDHDVNVDEDKKEISNNKKKSE